MVYYAIGLKEVVLSCFVNLGNYQRTDILVDSLRK